MTLDSIEIAIPRNSNNNELYPQNIVSPITGEYIESGSRLTGSHLNIKPVSTALGTENPELIWLHHGMYQSKNDYCWMNTNCGIEKLNLSETRSS
ncbi:hypothetical protein BOTNAR_0258g00100 [Botryotinia narcissicola]|uniref:Uncharacterized protein n=1 Tax=Botryotinia narcissicola TaxID=278944 RepID=A0A4Z1IDX3_9HELO|nr:hypothetical protein BOTNAR_0258g00100 [Botryotinia narcissicola]